MKRVWPAVYDVPRVDEMRVYPPAPERTAWEQELARREFDEWEFDSRYVQKFGQSPLA